MDDHDIELKVLRISIVTPLKLNVNSTSFKCHELLSHTCHESLHQTNEN
jgi:hypothetical protein